MRGIFLAAAAAVAMTASAGMAQAASYSVVNDYANTGANGVWSYGSGIGSAQTEFTSSFATCYTSNLQCQTYGASDSLPTVGSVTSGANASFSTVSAPSNVLLLHPGDGTDGNPGDASVVFTARTSGAYAVSGLFERLDTTTNGTGVIVSVYDNTTLESSATLPASGGYLSSSAFSGTYNLAAGDKLTFDVAKNGPYQYDSTGLSATVTSVPEPATWAMMILGMGGMGAVLRRRREGAFAAA